MKEIILDTLLDALKILPFLLVAFLIIELFEHKFSKKTRKIIGKSGKVGPLVGSLLGLFPQCGFSVLATNLYVTRIISLGSLIAIYLSTSDEMLPILLSKKVDISIIFKLLAVKFFVGCIAGFIIDFVLRRKKQVVNYDICEEENCCCEKGILYSAVTHTLHTLLFLAVASFLLNVLIHYIGEDTLASIFLKNSIFGPFVSSLIGLIPNCASSIVITELYLNDAISLGSTISGLLTGSGVAILVLFKTNKNIKENFTVVGLIYGIGVIVGIIIELLEIVF